MSGFYNQRKSHDNVNGNVGNGIPGEVTGSAELDVNRSGGGSQTFGRRRWQAQQERMAQRNE
ncbi:unnamed protein product [Taenia asiatica]|uniref:Stress-induced protein n=1 Tax=Taenia asiatica TaxID=60517 RepID=A0A0R3WED5_TAEAS|nr:unnamed protein product [Taenia asiatica]